jgi:hypothetical protein
MRSLPHQRGLLGRALAVLTLVLLLSPAAVDSAKRKSKKKPSKKSGGGGSGSGGGGASPVERPDGILPEQWGQLDEDARRQVAEQVDAMKPPPPPPPLVLEAEEDSAVEWEDWDQQKYAGAWASLEAVVQGGGGEEELRAAVQELLGRGWRPVHAAARHGQLDTLEILLDFLEPLVDKAELLRDQRGLTALHLASLAGELDTMKRLLPQGKLRKKARAVRMSRPARHSWHRPQQHRSQRARLSSGTAVLLTPTTLSSSVLGLPFEFIPPLPSIPLRFYCVTLFNLCSMQARVDPQDRHGSRPLHLAAGQGRVEAMRLLLKAGADPEAKVRHSFLNFMQQKSRYANIPAGSDDGNADRQTLFYLDKLGTAMHGLGVKDVEMVWTTLAGWLQTRGLATPLHVAASAGELDAMRLLMVSQSRPAR